MAMFMCVYIVSIAEEITVCLDLCTGGYWYNGQECEICPPGFYCPDTSFDKLVRPCAEK